jgi:hypothetical protein
MRKMLPFISVSVLFSGCCSMTDGRFCEDSFNSVACGTAVSGYTHTAVVYGDSTMIVIPISDIKEDTEWRFILAPITLPGDLIDYRTATVTITGKNADDFWINTAGPGNTLVTGDYATDTILTACVKGLPISAVDTHYHFEVEVAGVGTLDPRGRVR